MRHPRPRRVLLAALIAAVTVGATPTPTAAEVPPDQRTVAGLVVWGPTCASACETDEPRWTGAFAGTDRNASALVGDAAVKWSCWPDSFDLSFFGGVEVTVRSGDSHLQVAGSFIDLPPGPLKRIRVTLTEASGRWAGYARGDGTVSVVDPTGICRGSRPGAAIVDINLRRA